VTTQEFLARLKDVTPCGDGWKARCPAHADTHPSLTVSETPDRILVNCHARCPKEKILAALELTMADLFFAPRSPRPASPHIITKTYDYVSEDGTLLFQAVRYTPKAFRQRRPDGAGGWIWNLEGVRRVVYHLDELVEETTVYLVEGERDADRLRECSLTATTTPCGATAWRDDYAEQLVQAGIKDVIAIPDNDQPGRAYARAAARSLTRHGVTVRIVELPGVTAKGDVSDWLDVGHTVDELVDLGQKAPPFMAWDDDEDATAPSPVETASRMTSAAIEVIDAADLVTREYPDQPALVAGGLIVPRALVVNGGPAKRGKSLLVLNREIRRASSSPFLRFPTTAGRTLYIQAEIPEPQLKQRLVSMLDGCPDGPLEAETLRGRLLTVTRRGLFIDEPAGYDAIRQLIEQTEPDLLSLDPLARFFTGEENSAREVGRLINSLDRLIQAYGLAIELTHHTGKPSTGDPRQGGQRLRGSSALFGAADAVSMLDKIDDSWVLSFELRHAEEPSPMTLTRTPTLWYTLAGPPQKLLDVAAIVKDVAMRYSTLSGALAEDMKVSTATAERLIRDAKKAGLIWQGTQDGLYRATIKHHHEQPDGSLTSR
jgi:5S rRNA maturation endonuclease (ribonuclease M5)